MFFVFSFLRTLVFEWFYDIVVSNKDRNNDGRTVQGSRSYTNESDNGMRAGAANTQGIHLWTVQAISLSSL